MKSIEIRLGDRVRIEGASLPLEVIELLKKRLIFKNPLYYRNQKYGRPNYNVEPTLQCIWEDPEKSDLIMARGFLPELIRILHAKRIQFELADLSRKLPEVDFDFQGAPYAYQWEAWHELPKNRFGILVGPLGCGKKVLTLGLVARRKVPTLVMVTTKRALYQWKDLGKRFLGLEKDIGLIGDGYRELGRKFTIGITLTSYKVLDELKAQTGFLIVDECTRVNLKVLLKSSQFDCPYVLGLGRSFKRTDGLSGIMHAYLGPKVAEIWPENGWMSFQGLGNTRPLLKIKTTEFKYDYQDDWAEMVSALCKDEERNHLIATDILQATSDPEARALIISERVGHLEELLGRVQKDYSQGEIIANDITDKKRAEITNRFERGKLQIILVTFKSVPTVELKKVNRLFVVSPFKYDDHLIQVMGKLLGTGNRKEPSIIYDYRDRQELLQVSLKRRIKVYLSMGAIKIG